MAEYPTQLAGEGTKAHAALLDYIRMGKERSLDKLRQSYGKTAAYTRQLETWSSLYDWAGRAREYDTALAAVAAAQNQARYLADLEDHRKRASEAGKALYSVAGKLLQQINAALANPRKIKGEDGKVYTLHGIDLNANTFAIAARAMTISLDLEAHALSLDRLLPSLSQEDD